MYKKIITAKRFVKIYIAKEQSSLPKNASIPDVSFGHVALVVDRGNSTPPWFCNVYPAASAGAKSIRDTMMSLFGINVQLQVPLPLNLKNQMTEFMTYQLDAGAMISEGDAVITDLHETQCFLQIKTDRILVYDAGTFNTMLVVELRQTVLKMSKCQECWSIQFTDLSDSAAPKILLVKIKLEKESQRSANVKIWQIDAFDLYHNCQQHYRYLLTTLSELAISINESRSQIKYLQSQLFKKRKIDLVSGQQLCYALLATSPFGNNAQINCLGFTLWLLHIAGLNKLTKFNILGEAAEDVFLNYSYELGSTFEALASFFSTELHAPSASLDSVYAHFLKNHPAIESVINKLYSNFTHSLDYITEHIPALGEISSETLHYLYDGACYGTGALCQLLARPLANKIYHSSPKLSPFVKVITPSIFYSFIEEICRKEQQQCIVVDAVADAEASSLLDLKKAVLASKITSTQYAARINKHIESNLPTKPLQHLFTLSCIQQECKKIAQEDEKQSSMMQAGLCSLRTWFFSHIENIADNCRITLSTDDCIAIQNKLTTDIDKLQLTEDKLHQSLFTVPDADVVNSIFMNAKLTSLELLLAKSLQKIIVSDQAIEDNADSEMNYHCADFLIRFMVNEINYQREKINWPLYHLDYPVVLSNLLTSIIKPAVGLARWGLFYHSEGQLSRDLTMAGQKLCMPKETPATAF